MLIAPIDQRPDRLGGRFEAALLAPESAFSASVASLWEIAITTRLGKLALNVRIGLLPELIAAMRFDLLPIHARRVLANVAPEPPTRDPFDRLLLAQCVVDDLRLVTTDRALANHPLAFAAGARSGAPSRPTVRP